MFGVIEITGELRDGVKYYCITKDEYEKQQKRIKELQAIPRHIAPYKKKIDELIEQIKKLQVKDEIAQIMYPEKMSLVNETIKFIKEQELKRDQNNGSTK